MYYFMVKQYFNHGDATNGASRTDARTGHNDSGRPFRATHRTGENAMRRTGENAMHCTGENGMNRTGENAMQRTGENAMQRTRRDAMHCVYTKIMTAAIAVVCLFAAFATPAAAQSSTALDGDGVLTIADRTTPVTDHYDDEGWKWEGGLLTLKVPTSGANSGTQLVKAVYFEAAASPAKLTLESSVTLDASGFSLARHVIEVQSSIYREEELEIDAGSHTLTLIAREVNEYDFDLAIFADNLTVSGGTIQAAGSIVSISGDGGLTVSGNSTVNVTAAYNDAISYYGQITVSGSAVVSAKASADGKSGIVGKEGITINTSGTVTSEITSSNDDGFALFSDKAVSIAGGTVKLTDNGSDKNMIYALSVEKTGGALKFNGNDGFTVSELSPATGAKTGGAQVTVSGTNLAGVAGVEIIDDGNSLNTADATGSLADKSANGFKFTAPQLATPVVGPAFVKISDANGNTVKLYRAFSYTSAPEFELTSTRGVLTIYDATAGGDLSADGWAWDGSVLKLSSAFSGANSILFYNMAADATIELTGDVSLADTVQIPPHNFYRASIAFVGATGEETLRIRGNGHTLTLTPPVPPQSADPYADPVGSYVLYAEPGSLDISGGVTVNATGAGDCSVIYSLFDIIIDAGARVTAAGEVSRQNRTTIRPGLGSVRLGGGVTVEATNTGSQAAMYSAPIFISGGSATPPGGVTVTASTNSDGSSPTPYDTIDIRNYKYLKIVTAAAPALSAGTVNRASDTEATIGFTTDKAGTAYYLVVAGGAAAPAKADVKSTGASLGSVSAGAVSGKSVTLAAGAQDIYVVVDDGAGNLSSPLKIEAAAYVVPTYGISLSKTGTYTFTAITEGGSVPAPETVIVTNTGNQATGALTVALSGTNAGSFTLTGTPLSSIAAR